MFRSLGTAVCAGFRSKTSKKKFVIGWRGGFFVAVVSIKITNNQEHSQACCASSFHPRRSTTCHSGKEDAQRATRPKLSTRISSISTSASGTNSSLLRNQFASKNSASSTTSRTTQHLLSVPPDSACPSPDSWPRRQPGPRSSRRPTAARPTRRSCSSCRARWAPRWLSLRYGRRNGTTTRAREASKKWSPPLDWPPRSGTAGRPRRKCRAR